MSAARVGLVCGYLDPTRDGVADYTRRLAEHLRTRGVDAVVLTTYTWAGAAGDGVVGVAERWDVRGVVAAASAIRHLDLDVVHVQFAPSVFGFSRAVGLLPLLLPAHIPVVATLHEYGVWPGTGRGRQARSVLWSAAERAGCADRETLLLVPRAASLLIPAQEHLDVLRARFRHRRPAPTLEVPIGLNVDVATGQRAAARAAVRRELGTSPDAPLVVFFGFLHPDKALDRLITAVGALRPQLPAIQLVLIGGAESHSVPTEDARRLRRELDHVAAAQGVRDHVHFTGYLPDSEVSRLLLAADVAAFPFDAGVTRKSGSLLAALATGVPVVATATPGRANGNMQADGVLRVPPRDTAALREALERVLTDEGLAAGLAADGAAVATGHSWDAIAGIHAEVYACALASQRGSRSWTGAAEPSRVGPRRGERRVRMSQRERSLSLRERAMQGAAALGGELRRRASPRRRQAARQTEDPALFRTLVYGDPTRLHVASTAVVNNALFNLSSGEITVGEYAFFGHNVSVLTGTHDWTTFGAQRQVAVPTSGRDVVIEEGVWVSSNAIVVAPCRIGAHAVVGVGSLVLGDVEPYTIVAGNPARVLRTIPRPGEDEAEHVDPDAGAAGAVPAG